MSTRPPEPICDACIQGNATRCDVLTRMTKGEGRCTNCKEQDLECVVRDSSPQSPDAPVHQSTRKSQGKKTVRIDAQVDYMVEEYRGGDGKYDQSPDYEQFGGAVGGEERDYDGDQEMDCGTPPPAPVQPFSTSYQGQQPERFSQPYYGQHAYQPQAQFSSYGDGPQSAGYQQSSQYAHYAQAGHAHSYPQQNQSVYGNPQEYGAQNFMPSQSHQQQRSDDGSVDEIHVERLGDIVDAFIIEMRTNPHHTQDMQDTAVNALARAINRYELFMGADEDSVRMIKLRDFKNLINRALNAENSLRTAQIDLNKYRSGQQYGVPPVSYLASAAQMSSVAEGPQSSARGASRSRGRGLRGRGSRGRGGSRGSRGTNVSSGGAENDSSQPSEDGSEASMIVNS